jgi:hypothetical protein
MRAQCGACPGEPDTLAGLNGARSERGNVARLGSPRRERSRRSPDDLVEADVGPYVTV